MGAKLNVEQHPHLPPNPGMRPLHTHLIMVIDRRMLAHSILDAINGARTHLIMSSMKPIALAARLPRGPALMLFTRTLYLRPTSYASTRVSLSSACNQRHYPHACCVHALACARTSSLFTCTAPPWARAESAHACAAAVVPGHPLYPRRLAGQPGSHAIAHISIRWEPLSSEMLLPPNRPTSA